MSEEIDATPKQKIYYDQRSVALRTTQCVYFVQEHDKISMLDKVLKGYKDTQIVIVVRSKKQADNLSEHLSTNGFRASSVHGNHREEKQRETATLFNGGLLNIIITTDMILKSLELKEIKLVISYDLPANAQDYFNRLAYMQEEGEAIAFASPEDDKLLSNIEFNMKKEIKEEVIEGFIPSSETQSRQKKDKKKKPRHKKTKLKSKKEE